ncbi:unnamed protein product [Brassica oleracea]
MFGFCGYPFGFGYYPSGFGYPISPKSILVRIFCYFGLDFGSSFPGRVRVQLQISGKVPMPNRNRRSRNRQAQVGFKVMSNPRGGAEAHARSKHYVYRANTSLVLTGENRSRDTHEPTEETETLSGKIDPKSFGDRVAKGRPQEFEDKFKKFKKKQRDAGDDDVTKESRDAYEAMLSLIQRQLGGGPLNVANGAANKILAVLKNDAVNNHVKKVEIQKLLKPTPEEVDQVFNQFVSIGRFITDFQEGGDSCGGEGDEDGGLDVDFDVAVEFGGERISG